MPYHEPKPEFLEKSIQHLTKLDADLNSREISFHDLRNLVSILVKTVKELKQQNSELEAELTSLQLDMNDVKCDISSVESVVSSGLNNG